MIIISRPFILYKIGNLYYTGEVWVRNYSLNLWYFL